jgi:hypothetical protein
MVQSRVSRFPIETHNESHGESLAGKYPHLPVNKMAGYGVELESWLIAESQSGPRLVTHSNYYNSGNV